MKFYREVNVVFVSSFGIKLIQSINENPWWKLTENGCFLMPSSHK